MFEVSELLPYFDGSATMIFSLLVWGELRLFRKEGMALLHRIDERVKSG